jgi:hypothetical protein
MQVNGRSYTNSLRTRLRVQFSPLRATLILGAIIVGIVGNVLYIGNGGGPEWLGLASAIPIWTLVAWGLATDMKMRRLDREDRDQTPEGGPARCPSG